MFATQRAEVGRDANLEWVALGFGSARGKVRMETKLAGRGSSAKVTGAYAGDGRQHLDYDTTQEHAAEDTTSDLAFRGVLADRATAVWRGMIRVDPGAQRTDAFQESRNLLLSTDAHADAIPGLEIEADDVRCTHAAAVAQVDPEQLFYLRSHGLDDAQAKQLVVEGFLQELVERAHDGPIRETLRAELEAPRSSPARGSARAAAVRRVTPRALAGARARDCTVGRDAITQPRTREDPVARVGDGRHRRSRRVSCSAPAAEQDVVGLDPVAEPLGDRRSRARARSSNGVSRPQRSQTRDGGDARRPAPPAS